jgi:hypothetical protein
LMSSMFNEIINFKCGARGQQAIPIYAEGFGA